jgi:DNA-binding NtrC family response regulator
MADILIVDDDQAIATAFEHFLTYEGHTFRLASSAAEGMALLEQRSPDVVVMDVRMPGVDGVTALQQMRRRFPNLYVVMMTAYSSSQSSIDAIRAGAFDYLTKPLDLDELRDVIGRALAARQASGESAVAAAADLQPPVTLIGDTPAMLEVYKLIGRLATNSVTALIVGEHGTGKDLVVATIHGNSTRRDRPLVRLACASVSDAELDTALFGPGAGTVELAAIHLLPSPLQSRLAHALAAERTPGGGSRLTARLIVTTDRDLAEETAAGNFSRELYDEIGVIVLRLPPLRERREDIPLLVQHFIQRFNVELNRSIRGVDDQVARLMQAHAWPGNLAELERVIKRAAIVTRSDVITLHDIGESLTDNRFPGRPDVESALERAVRASLQERLVQADGTASSAFHDIVDAVESTLVREALAITNGNQVKAADILGVNRATLRKKMPDA